MTDLDRRSALAALAASAALGGEALAKKATPKAGAKAAPSYEPAPLPFDPAAIAGLSEKMLKSHHGNNYTAAVKRLGAIQAELAGLDFKTAPGFKINGLKREELIALNSMVLHEIYFRGFAGAATTPGAALAARIVADFGSIDLWRAEFSGMGKALGGGSGWALLTWSPRAGRLINSWAADHSMTVGDGEVLLALDCYEHAYAIDYGAAAGAYVDAFMAALRWDSADAAFAKWAGN